jgi:hypothetical protein
LKGNTKQKLKGRTMKAQHEQCGCMLVLEMDHRGVVGLFFSSGLGTGDNWSWVGSWESCLAESIINEVLSKFGSGMHK